MWVTFPWLLIALYKYLVFNHKHPIKKMARDRNYTVFNTENSMTGFFLQVEIFQNSYSRQHTWLLWETAYTFQVSLTHFCHMHLFCTPWKHQKTVRFSDVFWRKRKGALGTNMLFFFKGHLYFVLIRTEQDIDGGTERVHWEQIG